MVQFDGRSSNDDSAVRIFSRFRSSGTDRRPTNPAVSLAHSNPASSGREFVLFFGRAAGWVRSTPGLRRGKDWGATPPHVWKESSRASLPPSAPLLRPVQSLFKARGGFFPGSKLARQLQLQGRPTKMVSYETAAAARRVPFLSYPRSCRTNEKLREMSCQNTPGRYPCDGSSRPGGTKDATTC